MVANLLTAIFSIFIHAHITFLCTHNVACYIYHVKTLIMISLPETCELLLPFKHKRFFKIFLYALDSLPQFIPILSLVLMSTLCK